MTLSLSGAGAALESVVHDLAGVDPRLAALALVFHVANHLLRSVAWRNVIAAAYPHTRVRLLPIAAAYATGVALNAVAPARGGDAAKVALARAALPGSSVPTLAATVSVLVVFDLVFATALLLVVAAAGLVPVQLPVRRARPPRTGPWCWPRRPGWRRPATWRDASRTVASGCCGIACARAAPSCARPAATSAASPSSRPAHGAAGSRWCSACWPASAFPPRSPSRAS